MKIKKYIFIGVGIIFLSVIVLEIIKTQRNVEFRKYEHELRNYTFLQRLVIIIKNYKLATNEIPSSITDLDKYNLKSYDSRSGNVILSKNGDVLNIVYFDSRCEQEYKIGLHFIDDENFETVFLQIPDSKLFDMKKRFIEDSAFWHFMAYIKVN